MHSGVRPWWNDERIMWYERAAANTSFHAMLSERIMPSIDMKKPVLELGCGLGYVAEILCRKGVDITATDNDEKALKRAEKRSGLGIFRYLDADENLPRSEQLLMIFFSHLSDEKELLRYMSSTGRITYITSEHRYRESQKDRLRALLDEMHARYMTEEFEGPFDQPFLSGEDMERYIREYYPEDRRKEVLTDVEKGYGEFPYILRTTRRCTLFTIECREDL